MRQLNFYNRAIFVLSAFFLVSCSAQKQLSQPETVSRLLADKTIGTAHIGISIYSPEDKKQILSYQSERYFVPASNTKIFSCYAGLKYLGDSIPGIQYIDLDTAILLLPTGDPTLLHPAFNYQPVLHFIKSAGKPIYLYDGGWKETAFGDGWAWNDYNDYYMAERSPFPVYGNVVRWTMEKTGETPADSTQFDQSVSIYSIPEIDWDVRFNPSGAEKRFMVKRDKDQNRFYITQGTEQKRQLEVPFITNGTASAMELLEENQDIVVHPWTEKIPDLSTQLIYSQPVDSLLRAMMYPSDNFFAEQVLLMVSQKLMGRMETAAVIDTLLKKDLQFLPATSRWADGSGLSRYNLFTPSIFVSLLDHMQQEFGMKRIQQIFPTGGTGTLANYYKDLNGKIYAKTGSLQGVVALSGYLYTRKEKLLIFSVLVNNHTGSAADVRRKVEEFLVEVRERN